MRLRQIGGVLPVLLIVGGVSAPLGVAELTASDVPAPALGMRIAPTNEAGPGFLQDAFRAVSANDCNLAEGNVTALGTAPTNPTNPYALPTAEGAAPAVPRAEMAKPVAAPTVLGSQLRVGEPVATVTVAASCGPGHYRATPPVASPFRT